MQLSKKENIFCKFSWYFGNLHSMFNILKKKMTFIADVFLNLWTQRDVVT